MLFLGRDTDGSSVVPDHLNQPVSSCAEGDSMGLPDISKVTSPLSNLYLSSEPFLCCAHTSCAHANRKLWGFGILKDLLKLCAALNYLSEWVYIYFWPYIFSFRLCWFQKPQNDVKFWDCVKLLTLGIPNKPDAECVPVICFVPVRIQKGRLIWCCRWRARRLKMKVSKDFTHTHLHVS